MALLRWQAITSQEQDQRTSLLASLSAEQQAALEAEITDDPFELQQVCPARGAAHTERTRMVRGRRAAARKHTRSAQRAQQARSRRVQNKNFDRELDQKFDRESCPRAN